MWMRPQKALSCGRPSRWRTDDENRPSRFGCAHSARLHETNKLKKIEKRKEKTNRSCVYWPLVCGTPLMGRMMTLYLWGVVMNVMICKKFSLDRRRGIGSARGRFRRIAIDLQTRPWQLCLHYRAGNEFDLCMIVIWTVWSCYIDTNLLIMPSMEWKLN